MDVIYKYRLKREDKQEINLPSFSRILKFGKQGESLCLWALVPRESVSFETRIIEILGTGWETPQYDEFNLTYLDTIFDNEFVWHIFEKKLKLNHLFED